MMINLSNNFSKNIGLVTNRVVNAAKNNGAAATTSTATDTTTDPNKAKALAYLKEYVGQMRSAGFPDYNIRKKLEKIGSVYIPDNLPENFGRTGPWATGMADEFRMAAMKGGKGTRELLAQGAEQTSIDWIPSPDEFLNYMPGGNANRLPSNYGEFSGEDTSAFASPSGKFSNAKLDNLKRSLQEYSANYKGPKIGASQYAYEAGIAGLPQDIGQQYFQEFLSTAEKKAAEARQNEEYDALIMEYPEIDIQRGDTPEIIAGKIRAYNEVVAAQEQQNQTESEQAKKARVINEIASGFKESKGSIETAFQYALTEGVVLNWDDVQELYDNYYPTK